MLAQLVDLLGLSGFLILWLSPMLGFLAGVICKRTEFVRRNWIVIFYYYLFLVAPAFVFSESLFVCAGLVAGPLIGLFFLVKIALMYRSRLGQLRDVLSK